MDGLYCCEKFRKFLSKAKPEPKTAGFPASCEQRTAKRFTVNQWYRWKAWSPAFWRSQFTTIQISMGNPKPTNKFVGSRNLFPPSYPRRRKILWIQRYD